MRWTVDRTSQTTSQEMWEDTILNSNYKFWKYVTPKQCHRICQKPWQRHARKLPKTNHLICDKKRPERLFNTHTSKNVNRSTRSHVRMSENFVNKYLKKNVSRFVEKMSKEMSFVRKVFPNDMSVLICYTEMSERKAEDIPNRVWPDLWKEMSEDLSGKCQKMSKDFWKKNCQKKMKKKADYLSQDMWEKMREGMLDGGSKDMSE